MADDEPIGRLMRLKEVLSLVPLSRSTIYARGDAGTFPRRINLGGNVVAWRESEIREWLASCIETTAAN